MKAIVIDHYGKAPVQLRDMPDPVPGPGEVLVEVHAASINPVDSKIRDGKLKALLPLKMPQIMGNDLAGVVKVVGEGASRFKVGDAVYARLDKTRLGAFAELAAVHESLCALKPSNLDFVQSASMALVGLTAWQALVEIGNLKAGQKALIHAGAGGVGSFAIQLAKHLGATVVATASARNAGLCTELGADLVINYAQQRFEDVVHDCDVVLDSLGEDTLLRSFSAAKPGAVVVSIAGMPDLPTAKKWNLNPAFQLALRFLNRKINAEAKRKGITYRYLFMEPNGEQLGKIAALAEQGKIKPLVERTFPLAEADQALTSVEAGRTRGKVVLKVK
jgi:NADPH:quinone reductase-like Zn-dependent oxidoreductase